MTKRELREAEKIRDRFFKLGGGRGGGCGHEPRCQTVDDCLLVIVDGRRQERAEALARRSARLAS